MIKGFSAPATAFGTRKRLIAASRTELLLLSVVAAAVCLLLALYALLVDTPDSRLWMLLPLFVVQYATACLDLLLRMQRAHSRLALFMMVRNLPSVLMLMLLHPTAPLQVVGIDFAAALFVTGFFLRSKELRIRHVLRLRWPRKRLDKEQLTLWLARLVQFGNSSLLRLLVPLAYGLHDTGLFFFALIAQLPCSLFLSVTTQLFGHALARVKPGEWRLLLQTQAWFALPNIGYALAAVLLLPYWGLAISFVPSLAKYADAAPLVLAVVVYSTVLASDCQEYLLRARGLSRILLAFSGTSLLLQGAVVGLASWLSMSLVSTLHACAAVQALTLAAFSTYSFHRVIGRFAWESGS